MTRRNEITSSMNNSSATSTSAHETSFNSTRKGVVSAKKIPQSINQFLKDVFSEADRVVCTEVRTDHAASYQFAMLNGLVVKLSIEEGGQA